MKRKTDKANFYICLEEMEKELLSTLPISKKKRVVLPSVVFETTKKYCFVDIPTVFDHDMNRVRDLNLPIKVKEVEADEQYDYIIVDMTIKSYRTASTKKEYTKIIKEIFPWSWEAEKYLKNNPW